MACARDTGLRRIDLQTEPILPEGYGLLSPLGALFDVLDEAFGLKRKLEKRYLQSRE